MADDATRTHPAETDLTGHANVLHFLAVAWRHRGLLALGLVLGSLLGVLYYVTAAPIYSSSAQVLVVQKKADEAVGSTLRQGAFQDYVSTHQVLISSPLIINKAITKRRLDQLQSFFGWEEKYASGGPDLVSLIKKSVAVVRQRGQSGSNNVLEVSFTGPVAEDCSTVLAALIEGYKEFLDETYKGMTDDTLDLITKARRVLDDEVKLKEAAYLEFREKAPLLGNDKENGGNIRHDGVMLLQQKRLALTVRRAELEGQVASVQKARKAGASPEALLQMVMSFSGKTEADEQKREAAPLPQEQLIPLLDEEQRLLASGFGPKSSRVVAVRARIEQARAVLTRPGAAFLTGKDDEANRAARNADVIDLHLAALQQKVDLVTENEDKMKALFDKEFDEARKLFTYELKDTTLRKEIDRSTLIYETLVKRLSDATLVKDAGGYDARPIAPPSIGLKVGPRIMFVFPMALIIGFMIGGGLAYLAEITDTSFRSPEEVGQRLGLPIIGYVPEMKIPSTAVQEAVPGAARLDPTLSAHHRPRSQESEAIRGVRTALYFGTRGRKYNVIQVTSPNPSDGKSTVTANLAICIAQSGKRVVLIDADLRKPRVHHLFGIVNDGPGLSSLLIEDCELPDAIRKSGVENLDIIPCGPLPPNPAELLTSTRVVELLGALRERYDYVIVDSPPLLAVTDPCVIAPAVDGVVLVVRMSKHARPPAERASKILNTLGGVVAGVVVNRVDSRNNAYGYGYGYGYGNYGDVDGDGSVARTPSADTDGQKTRVAPDQATLPG